MAQAEADDSKNISFIKKVWESHPDGLNNIKLFLSENVQGSLDEFIKKSWSDANNDAANNSGGLTNQPQSLNVSVNKSFK